MQNDSDADILEQHARQVETVAEAVFGLIDKFQIPPATLFEGALKGAIIGMAIRQGDSPAEIADMLEEASEAVRCMEPGEWQKAMN